MLIPVTFAPSLNSPSAQRQKVSTHETWLAPRRGLPQDDDKARGEMVPEIVLTIELTHMTSIQYVCIWLYLIYDIYSFLYICLCHHILLVTSCDSMNYVSMCKLLYQKHVWSSLTLRHRKWQIFASFFCDGLRRRPLQKTLQAVCVRLPRWRWEPREPTKPREPRNQSQSWHRERCCQNCRVFHSVFSF